MINHMAATVVLCLSLFGGAIGLAEDEPRPYIAKYSSGEFELEKDLVDKIYSETQQKRSTTPNPARFIPMLTMVSALEIELVQTYFTTDYSDQLDNMIFGGMRLETGLLTFGISQLQGYFDITYGYLQDKIDTVSSEGIVASDDIKLQWLPIQSGASFSLKTPLPWIRPRFELGFGYHWLHQAGQLDGLSQSYWVPTYHANIGLMLFEREDQAFPGLLVIASRESDFGNEESTLSTVAFKAGASFRL